ncbi:MAG: cupin domain-containing protein [Acidimicrobiia bacterium]|nr:cupin domain-containing protein [Acidimicrobiia bacterium]
MTGWIGNIEEATTANTNFRTVLFTGEHMQLTVMSIPSGSEIGLEAHGHLDQFIRVEGGRGRVDMGPAEDQINEHHDLSDDWVAIIPAGTWHNVVNTGDDDLKLYSIYTPPEHPDGTVHVTKEDADAAEAEHDH